MPRPTNPTKVSPFGRNQRLSPWRLTLVLALALALLFFISLTSGYLPFTVPEIWQITKVKLFGLTTELDESRVLILWDLRLPRLFTALLTGAALSLSGAIFQGLLLNPLADPYTLGVSSGAALGASLVIVAGLIFPDQALFFEPWVLTSGAFLTAALTLVAVTTLARDRRDHLSPTNLILAGVIISAILSAATSFIKYLAGEQVTSIIFWLLGSFQARVWTDAGLILIFFIPALAISLWSAVDLNIITLGPASAKTLGVNTRRVRFNLLAAATLAASAAVSVAGIIGFVGLIVPHLIRLLIGPDHRALLPLSALGGGTLLLAADTMVRAVLPGEIPVGVLTALLAGPAFLIIFRQRLR